MNNSLLQPDVIVQDFSNQNQMTQPQLTSNIQLTQEQLLDKSNISGNNSFLEKSPKIKISDLKSAINDRNIRKQFSGNKINFNKNKKK